MLSFERQLLALTCARPAGGGGGGGGGLEYLVAVSMHGILTVGCSWPRKFRWSMTAILAALLKHSADEQALIF